MRQTPEHSVPETALVTTLPEPVNGGARSGLALLARTVGSPDCR